MKTVSFKLNEARAGATVVTASGKRARIINWNSGDKQYPIVAMVEGTPLLYSTDGLCINQAEPGLNLYMQEESGYEDFLTGVQKKIFGTINERIRQGGVFSKEEARKMEADLLRAVKEDALKTLPQWEVADEPHKSLVNKYIVKSGLRHKFTNEVNKGQTFIRISDIDKLKTREK